jgi:hypothetical protein
MSAIAAEGTRSCHGQHRARASADGVALLEHRLREALSRLVMSRDGAPLHRRHRIRAFPAHDAASRLPLERLPADAPGFNPGEGRWAYRKGGERRQVGCCRLPH